MAPRRPSQPALILVGAVAVGAAAAGVGVQRRLRRAIARDPLSARLQSPPAGTPLQAVSADGTRLHIELFGTDGAPTFVLAHGWTERLSYWTLVSERLLARGFRVAAYDLRGHGNSAPAADGDYSAERFGEDVEAVLDAIGAGGDAERAIVVGHSLGAMSIVAWAARHAVSRRASAVGLLNTGVGDLIAESLLIPVPWLATVVNRTPLGVGLLSSRGRLPAFSTPLSYAMIRYIAFGPSATPAMVAFYERMLLACPPDVRADVGLALSNLALSEAVPQIDVPALVLAGELDRLTPPAHAERIAAALPQLQQLVVLPQTGHMGPLERPDEIGEALLSLAVAGGARASDEPATGVRASA
jgi:pimeloyl-ACP methyl ester carboxylesterase